METIRTYIETMFKGFMDNQEMRDLKEEMTSNMQDRYEELKGQGKSENEAVGTVISEFGNIDELTSEMGYQNIENDSGKATKELMASQEEVMEYVKASKNLGKKVGLGVGIILFCAALFVMGEGFAVIFTKQGTDMNMFLSIFMVLGVCAAVAIFIYYGMGMLKYEELYEGKKKVDTVTLSILETEYNGKKDKFTLKIVAGVVLCIMSSIPVMMSKLFDINLAVETGTAITIAMVAIAVYIFITAGVEMSAYDELIKKDNHYFNKDYEGIVPESAEAEKVIEIVMGIMWPIIVIIYLCLGFIGNLWHPGWIIFVIGGILTPVIAIMVNLLTRK